MAKQLPGFPSNKVRFACFACRRMFKQQGSSYWDDCIPDRPYPCPERKQDMARIGPFFKAPRKTAVRYWRKLEQLYQAGERFMRPFRNPL